MLDPLPRLSPADCTCFRVRGAARRVTQIYDRHLAPAGLSITQFAILGHVVGYGPLPLGRLADPDEPAQAALWLLGRRSSFVTGSSIVCDGGVLAKASISG